MYCNVESQQLGLFMRYHLPRPWVGVHREGQARPWGSTRSPWTFGWTFKAIGSPYPCHWCQILKLRPCVPLQRWLARQHANLESTLFWIVYCKSPASLQALMQSKLQWRCLIGVHKLQNPLQYFTKMQVMREASNPCTASLQLLATRRRGIKSSLSVEDLC